MTYKIETVPLPKERFGPGRKSKERLALEVLRKGESFAFPIELHKRITNATLHLNGKFSILRESPTTYRVYRLD